jgi:hypothetical protein
MAICVNAFFAFGITLFFNVCKPNYEGGFSWFSLLAEWVVIAIIWLAALLLTRTPKKPH